MLAPILERVVREGAGRAVLAKVNLDTSPGLASRFGVQAIPNVKVFRDGKVVLNLTGVLPEPELRRPRPARPAGTRDPEVRPQWRREESSRCA